MGHHVVDRPDPRFGGASQADELGVGEGGACLCRQRAGDEITREKDELQIAVRRETLGLTLLEEHLEQGRHRVPRVDAGGMHQVDPRARVLGLRLRRQDQRTCAREGPEDVVDGQVEGEPGHSEHRPGP